MTREEALEATIDIPPQLLLFLRRCEPDHVQSRNWKAPPSLRDVFLAHRGFGHRGLRELEQNLFIRPTVAKAAVGFVFFEQRLRNSGHSDQKKQTDNTDRMRTKDKNLPIQYGEETRFGVEARSVPFRATLETELERLKTRLIQGYLSEFAEPEFNRLLRQAANEAAAIAGTSAYPLLLLPALLDEKAREARRQVAKQNLIRSRSAFIMDEVAA